MSACRCRPVCGETKPGKRCKCGCHEPPAPAVRPYTARSAADEIVAWARTGSGIHGTVHGIVIDAIEDARPPVDPVEAVLRVPCLCGAGVGVSCDAEDADWLHVARIRSALGQGQGESGAARAASALRAAGHLREDGDLRDIVCKWLVGYKYFEPPDSDVCSNLLDAIEAHVRKQDTRSAEGAKESPPDPPTPVK